MSKEDFYSILKVPRTASADEVKKAYRKLAMKYHPDQNPGDKTAEDMFKKVSEAYEVLSDPQKRKMYDQFGHAGSQQAGGFRPGQNPFEGFPGFESGGFGGAHYSTESAHDLFNEIFGDIFGGGGRRRRAQARPQKGADLKYTQTISLEEAAKGTEKRVSFIRIRNNKEESASLSVSIPAGVREGQRLKLKAEGDSGTFGGPNGDLFVVINFAEHPLFKRKDLDVVLEVPISFVDAILGTSIEVPTLLGRASLNIPKSTMSGQVFRLKGKGFPDVKTKAQGDMLVKIIIDTAKNLTEDEEALLKKLSKLSQKAPLVQQFNAKMEQVLKTRK